MYLNSLNEGLQNMIARYINEGTMNEKNAYNKAQELYKDLQSDADNLYNDADDLAKQVYNPNIKAGKAIKLRDQANELKSKADNIRTKATDTYGLSDSDIDSSMQATKLNGMTTDEIRAEYPWTKDMSDDEVYDTVANVTKEARSRKQNWMQQHGDTEVQEPSNKVRGAKKSEQKKSEQKNIPMPDFTDVEDKAKRLGLNILYDNVFDTIRFAIRNCVDRPYIPFRLADKYYSYFPDYGDGKELVIDDDSINRTSEFDNHILTFLRNLWYDKYDNIYKAYNPIDPTDDEIHIPNISLEHCYYGFPFSYKGKIYSYAPAGVETKTSCISDVHGDRTDEVNELLPKLDHIWNEALKYRD